MLAQVGIDQLKRNKGRFFGSIIAILMGMSILWGIATTIDTLHHTYELHERFLYGGIDFTVFNSSARDELESSSRFEAGNYTLPSTYLYSIKMVEGVKRVVSRMGCTDVLTVSSSDYNDKQRNAMIFVINATNPDEDHVGTGIIIDCMDIYGDPENVTLSDMLKKTGDIEHPAVITEKKSNEYGWTIGDSFKIQAMDLVKPYATPDELTSIQNGSRTYGEVNASIFENISTWINFTITGIIIDGSESLESPFNLNDWSVTMVPKQDTIFISKKDADEYVYNHANESVSSYFALSIEDGVNVEIVEGRLISLLGDGFEVYNLAKYLASHRNFVVTLARSFLLAGSALAIIISAILSQSVMEMNMSEQLRNIGILLSLGIKKRKIAEIIMPQVILISIVGVVLGTFVGYIVPSLFDSEGIIKLLSENTVYEITVSAPITISLSSAIISISVGLAFPILFGIIPLLKLRKWDIETLLSPHSTDREPKVIKFKKKVLKLHQKGKNVDIFFKKIKRVQKLVVISLLVSGMVISSISMYYVATNMFPYGSIQVTEVFYSHFGIFLLLMLAFVLAFLAMFKDIIQAFTVFISRVFGKFIGEMKEFIPKTIKIATNKRNRRNLSNTLIIVTTLATTLFVIHDTVTVRNGEIERSLLGCDIGIYYPLLTKRDVSDITTSVLGIDSATSVSYHLRTTWVFNSIELPDFIVNSVDDFGGSSNGIMESMNIIVIQDVKTFMEVNPIEKTFYEFDKKKNGMSITEIMYSLEDEDHIIIQDTLAKNIDKSIGDDVDMVIFGMQVTFEVVGIVSSFPSAPQMYIADPREGDDVKTMVNTRTAIISFKALSRKIRDYLGIDLMIKNRNMDGLERISNETIPTNVSGITSGLIDKDDLSNILNGIENISSYSFRFSTFSSDSPKITAIYNESRLLYSNGESLPVINETMNIKLRSYVFDPVQESMTCGNGDGIIECIDFLNDNKLQGRDGLKYYNETVMDVLYGAQDFIYPKNHDTRQSTTGNMCYAVVNKYFTSIDDQGSVEFVYENEVGDTFNVTFVSSKGLVNQEFTIIGTSDSHYAYHIGNDDYQENLVISKESLNYNSNVNMNDSLVMLTDYIDVEANVLLTTFDELRYMEFLESGFPFELVSDEMINHVYVSLIDGTNATFVSEQIKDAGIAVGMNNLSISLVKDIVTEKLHLGSLQVRIKNGFSKQDVIDNLESWYENHSYSFNYGYVGITEKFNADLLTVADAFNIVTVIAIFSLIVSQVGLAIIIYMMMKTRRRDIAILRTLGISNKSIMKMIATESFVSSFASIIFGILIGTFIMLVFTAGVSVPLLIPFHASVPWVKIITVLSISFAITFFVGMLNARYVLKIPIDENIRSTTAA